MLMGPGQRQYQQRYGGRAAPLNAIELLQVVEHAALLTVAAVMPTAVHHSRHGMQLAHPKPPVVMLLLRQIAPALYHLSRCTGSRSREIKAVQGLFMGAQTWRRHRLRGHVRAARVCGCSNHTCTLHTCRIVQ